MNGVVFQYYFQSRSISDKTSLINKIYKELDTNTQVKSIFNPLTQTEKILSDITNPGKLWGMIVRYCEM